MFGDAETHLNGVSTKGGTIGRGTDKNKRGRMSPLNAVTGVGEGERVDRAHGWEYIKATKLR